MKPRTTFQLLFAAAIITLIGTSIQIFDGLPTDAPHTANLGLLLVFGIAVTIGTYFREKVAVVRAYLLINTSVILTILLLNDPNTGLRSFTLFFVLTSGATLLLPTREAILWVVAIFFSGLAAVAYLYELETSFGWTSMAGGHFLFAAIGYMMRQSNLTRYKTEQLYAELQESHTKLQRFTAQSQQLAVAEERNRLAREMHDSLGHRLTVAILQLEGAHHLIQSEPERATTMVGNMRDQLKEALVELRQALSTLRSEAESPKAKVEIDESALSRLNGSNVNTLVDDIGQLIESFGEATGLTIHQNLPAEPPTLLPAQRLALFRASQELLTNVQRHALATKICFELAVEKEGESGVITLTVTDDGQGMPAEITEGRFGLQGLQERATQLEGKFTIRERVEGGTVVQLALPISTGTVNEAKPVREVPHG